MFMSCGKPAFQWLYQFILLPEIELLVTFLPTVNTTKLLWTFQNSGNVCVSSSQGNYYRKNCNQSRDDWGSLSKKTSHGQQIYLPIDIRSKKEKNKGDRIEYMWYVIWQLKKDNLKKWKDKREVEKRISSLTASSIIPRNQETF